MKTQPMRGLLLAATTALLWGFLAIALKIAVRYFDVYTIVWFRFTVAFSVLTIYTAIRQPAWLTILRRPPLMAIGAAVLLGGNYIGFMQGVNHAGPGITQVIIQTGPVMLGLIGFLFFKESITRLRMVGFALAAFGFGLFYYQQLQQLTHQAQAIQQGVLWTLFGAASWTGYAIFNKLLVQKWPSQQLNLIIYGLPAILFLPFANVHAFAADLPWWVYVLMVALGLNTLVAYGTLSASFKYVEANKISIIITLNPIITFGLLELMLWMDIRWIHIDPFSNLAYAGALLVLLGAILAIGMKRKAK